MVAKLVNKMILNRRQPKIDKHLCPNQNGFRPGRSTTSHTRALRRLIEGVKTQNKKAIIICRLQQGIRFHTQMHDDENSESVWRSTKTTCSNQQTVREHKSKSDYTRRRNRILSNNRRCTSSGHTSSIPFCNRPRLRHEKKHAREERKNLGFTYINDRVNTFPQQ